MADEEEVKVPLVQEDSEEPVQSEKPNELSDDPFAIKLLRKTNSPFLALFESDDCPIGLKNSLRRLEISFESMILEKYPDLPLEEAEKLVLNSDLDEIKALVNANLGQILVAKALEKLPIEEEQKRLLSLLEGSPHVAAFLEFIQDALHKKGIDLHEIVMQSYESKTLPDDQVNVIKEAIIEAIKENIQKNVEEALEGKELELDPDASIVEQFLYSLDDSKLRPELRLLLALYKTKGLPPPLKAALKQIEKSVEIAIISRHPDLPLEKARDAFLEKDEEAFVAIVIDYFVEYIMTKLMDEVAFDPTLKSAMMSQIRSIAESDIGQEFFHNVESKLQAEAGIGIGDLIILVWNGEGKKELEAFKLSVESASQIFFTNKLMLLAEAGHSAADTGAGGFDLLISCLKAMIRRDKKLQEICKEKDLKFTSKEQNFELILALVTDPDMPIPIRMLLRHLETQIEEHILKSDETFSISQLDDLLDDEHTAELEAVILNGFKNLLLTNVLKNLPLPPEFRNFVTSSIEQHFTPENIDSLLTQIAHLVANRDKLKELFEALLTGKNEKALQSVKTLIVEEFENNESAIIDRIGDNITARMRQQMEEDDESICQIMLTNMKEAIMGRILAVFIIAGAAIGFVVAFTGQIIFHIIVFLSMWQWFVAVEWMFFFIYFAEISFVLIQVGCAMLCNPLIGIVGGVMGLLEAATRTGRVQQKTLGQAEERNEKFDLDAYTDYAVGSAFKFLKRTGLAAEILNAIFDPKPPESDEERSRKSKSISQKSKSRKSKSKSKSKGDSTAIRVHPSGGVNDKTYQSGLYDPLIH